jgi:D-threo-aldose 1-dehydrogenase
LSVSAVCAGGAVLAGMPEVFGYDVSPAEAITVIREVLAGPLRWIDTANGYGDSEHRIGRAITEYGGLPADFLVATKVDALGKDYSGTRVRKSVAASKERLGLDQLPLVYLHDPEFHDFDSMGDAVRTLMQLREEGEIGHVGLAGGNVHELARYLDLGGFEVLLVHNRWTLVDHSADPLFERAHAEGIAIVNAAIYGGGLLANPSGGSKNYGYRTASAETLEAVARMDQACRNQGTDLATASLQHSVNDPRIAATVVGFSKPGRLDRLVAALESDLSPELVDQLAELMPAKQHWLEGS